MEPTVYIPQIVSDDEYASKFGTRWVNVGQPQETWVTAFDVLRAVVILDESLRDRNFRIVKAHWK